MGRHRAQRILLIVAGGLFCVSVVGTLVGLGVFFYYDTDFWDVFGVDEALRVAATLLAGLAVSSGVLYLHFRKRESYVTFESLLFLIVFGVAFCNLLWVLPALIVG